VRRGRTPGPPRHAARGAADAAADAPHGRDPARSPGTLVPGDRQQARPARRHGEIAHQPRPARTGAAIETSAGQTVGASQPGDPLDAAQAPPRSAGMNLNTEQANGVSIIRVGESRLMYPLLSEFATAVTQLIAAGEKKIIVDLSTVGY